MASNKLTAESRLSDSDNVDDTTNVPPPTSSRNKDGNTSSVSDSTSHSPARKKRRRKSRYSELDRRFSALENMFKDFMKKSAQTGQTCNESSEGQTLPPQKRPSRSRSSYRAIYDSDSESEPDDNVSLFACGQISPGHESADSNNNCIPGEENLTKEQKNDLFNMFGDDAIVKKDKKVAGLVLDKSQIEVISAS